MFYFQGAKKACQLQHISDLQTKDRAEVENALEFIMDMLKFRADLADELQGIADEFKCLNEKDETRRHLLLPLELP